MKFIKYVGVFALVATTLTFTGCTEDQANLGNPTSQADGYGQQNNQYKQNNRTDSRLYRLGKDDGCNSMKGIVTPGLRNGNEVKYKDSIDYTDGFRKGMKVCAKR